MLELFTLGGSTIRHDGAELTGLSAHKQKLALIAYLAVEGPVSRDNLLGLFWPEKPEAKARHSLSQALYSLRRELGEECVSQSGDQVGLASERLTVDVKELGAAAEEERWEQVVELYRGPFLDQFYLPEVHGFEEWQSQTRAWVGSLARKGFAKVIASRCAAGDTTGALAISWRWAKLEPLEDEAQHALIALLAIGGDRSAALDQYEAYRSRLARELELEPLEQTVEMVEGIRSGVLPGGALLGAAPPPAPAAEAGGVPEKAAAAEEPAIAMPADLDEMVRQELAPRLEIERKLGESSTSDVYLAVERGLNRQVAVKVFSPKLAADRRARMRFAREVQAVASLTHPNIAALHWAGSLSNGLPYFVMQYVEGLSMAEKLRLEGRLTNDQARRVLSQLASALASAHRRGIVHRDVQPANVLCDEEAGRCLLADFGISAILATAEQRPARITESGELVGDPVWMSPEQMKAEGVSERSDIYSLGLLGYQLLAEQSPYVWETRQELYAAHVNQPPRRLSELCPGVDRDLERLLLRCLAKEPHQRPTASRLARELSAPAAPDEEPDPFWQRLIWRRVPQWLGAYLAGGWGIVELIETATVRGYLSESWVDASLFSYLLLAPVVFILAWYHGRAGPQRVERLEAWLLAAVAVIWLAFLVAFLVL